LWVFAAVLGLLAAARSATAAAAVDGDPTSSPVTFAGSGGTVLHGTVVTPAAGGRRPGIVLVSGSGPQKATDERDVARAFARGGVVSLVYDKRTAGYSQFQRSYRVLADDALAAVDVLRGRAGVDPAQVGIWGESEGAWVASLAASGSPDVAFVVTVGAAGETPAQQTAWSDANDLRHAGVSGSLVPAVEQGGIRLAAGAGAFPEADYDPVPAWEHVHQPVLALWGDHDQEVPVAESARIIRQALDRGGNSHYTIRFFTGASHGLRVPRGGGFEGGSLLTAPGVTPLAAGYPELVAAWVGRLASGPPPATAETPPHQVSAAPPQSVPLTPLGWYEAPPLQLAVLALLLVAFLGSPLIGLLRGRRHVTPVRLPARALAAAGLIIALGLPVYLVFLLETAGVVPGPVVAGRPLPWLVLQLAALIAVVATIGVAVSGWRMRRQLSRDRGARLALLLTGGVVLVPWAAYWGLLRQ
jgi:dienelactone hydrolase